MYQIPGFRGEGRVVPSVRVEGVVVGAPDRWVMVEGVVADGD